MSWLRKPKPLPEFDEDPIPGAPAPRAESAYVPASMRPRPIIVPPAVHDDVDEDDEQVKFLASLAEQVHRDAASRDGAPVRPARTEIIAANEAPDEMWAFREKAAEYDPYEGVRRHVEDDVAIDELRAVLSLPAAALRRRRAA
jgi:hypothetical protein